MQDNMAVSVENGNLMGLVDGFKTIVAEGADGEQGPRPFGKEVIETCVEWQGREVQVTGVGRSSLASIRERDRERGLSRTDVQKVKRMIERHVIT